MELDFMQGQIGQQHGLGQVQMQIGVGYVFLEDLIYFMQ